jgi:hypothetical protein
MGVSRSGNTVGARSAAWYFKGTPFVASPIRGRSQCKRLLRRCPPQ